MNWPHYRAAAELKRIKNARVLVVGANTGEDCRPFVEMGAAEVHGLDPIEDVGSEFQNSKVTYHKAIIEESGLPANYFDLVFSVATLEHVADIESAYVSMCRTCRPGGAIYACASPLWNSPYGHHMASFDAHPWVHLIYDRDELVRFARREGIDSERGHSIEAIADYMFLSDAFNRRPSTDYAKAAAAIKTETSWRLDYIDRYSSDILSSPNASIAKHRGYRGDELTGVTHYYKAIKRGGGIEAAVNRIRLRARCTG